MVTVNHGHAVRAHRLAEGPQGSVETREGPVVRAAAEGPPVESGTHMARLVQFPQVHEGEPGRPERPQSLYHRAALRRVEVGALVTVDVRVEVVIEADLPQEGSRHLGVGHVAGLTQPARQRCQTWSETIAAEGTDAVAR